MDNFPLINKEKSRKKVFEPFEDLSKPGTCINAMMISDGCVYKSSSKPVFLEVIFNLLAVAFA